MALDMYLDQLRMVKDQKPKTLVKPRDYVRRIELILKKPILESGRTDIINAILAVTDGRKIKFNGGHQDSGKNFKYRMGTVMRQFFTWAHAEGIIPLNLFPQNPFQRPPIREAKYLTEAELTRLMTDENLTVQEHALVRFMLDTGMRKMELIRTRVKAVKFDERLVHIPDTKNSKFRTVPFSEKTLHWIKMYLEMKRKPSEYLFSTLAGTPFCSATLGNKFKKISAKIGYRLSSHMLRHTCGTLWAKAGIDGLLIMRMLGHVDTKVTAMYVHAEAGHLRKLQEKVVANTEALEKGRQDLFLNNS